MAEQSIASYLAEQWRAILICLFITIGAFQFGYDSSYFSGNEVNIVSPIATNISE
jgi:MFS transporter, SP family, sugar:H+ symporter